MTGGDPKLAIHENIPQITDEDIDGVLAVIEHLAPEKERGMFIAMLGLDGAKVTVHKAQNLRGIYA